MKQLRGLALLCAAIASLMLTAEPLRAEAILEAVQGSPDAIGENFAIGQRVYKQTCAGCHDSGLSRAPQPPVLSNMKPQTIYRAITEGAMKPMAASLTDKERVAVAEFLSHRKLTDAGSTGPTHMCNARHAAFDRKAPPTHAGWGYDMANSHAVSAKAAGFTRADLGKFKLKWAYGFADASRARSQPSLAGGAIFTGSHNGDVLALDRATGCERWRYQARAEVRTSVLVESWTSGDSSAEPLAFFGDLAGTVYAVKAFTGEKVWTTRADSHNAAVITATPALHNGVLYVTVSSLEESSAVDPSYVCCTFRGSVVALDAKTGKEIWRTYTVGEPQKLKDEDGRDTYGPSGVAVWNTPAIDPGRDLLYVATGDNYSQPATELSDAVLALDMKTGRIVWSHQATEGDAWNVGCFVSGANCPDDAGPDFDFGSGVILVKSSSGRDLVLAGQKSGVAYAFDADTGEQVWKRRVGRGGLAGGILFGMAAQNGTLYAPVSDYGESEDSSWPASPGLYAIDIDSGELAWSAPMANTCRADQKACIPGISSPPTATPEFVIAGSDDGRLRAYAADTGEVILNIDLAREWETMNGVDASGGSMSGGAAPIVDGGQIIVASGYGQAIKMPGNVLLVFEKE